MPTKEQLDKKNLTELASLCQQVANDPIKYTQVGAAEAFTLKLTLVQISG